MTAETLAAVDVLLGDLVAHFAAEMQYGRRVTIQQNAAGWHARILRVRFALNEEFLESLKNGGKG